MIEAVREFLDLHITGPDSRLIIHIVILTGIAVLAVGSYYLMRLVEGGVMFFVRKSPTKWDDDILNTRCLKAISQLVPAIVVALLLPRFFSESDSSVRWIDIFTQCYILWTVVYIISVLISNLFTAFSHRKRFRPYAVKGIFQMVRLIVIAMGIIITVSIFIGRSPVSILMALGASAAILMLVFKDTILGLVASVQLTANDMLHKGDWIVVDRRDVNGEVLDISLTTVKVRNWDNSVVTVPPYSLISESFVNYQPMRRSGGRRVSRSILIDANSVRFCTTAEIDGLQRRGWLDEGNAGADSVNMRLLRDYLERWLADHTRVRHDMLMMVRQMEPTSMGLPLQLYFFTDATDWRDFERVQSDIFDHVYAVIREFGLRIYQVDSGDESSRDR